MDGLEQTSHNFMVISDYVGVDGLSVCFNGFDGSPSFSLEPNIQGLKGSCLC